MSEPFKNIKELYQALIDGKTIQNNQNLDQAKLGFDKLLYKAHAKDAFVYPGLDYVFYQVDQWSIYEEPKWYDNIPKRGVLCKTTHGAFVFIKGRCSNGTYIDCNGNTWINVTPVTKEEVMQYIWNGEDE